MIVSYFFTDEKDMATQEVQSTFLKGRITLPLVRFTIPLALAMIVQALYGAVDMVIVGQLGTTADVSAVGTGSLIIQALTAVISGLSMGITVRLGFCIGAGDRLGAARTLGGMIRFFSVACVLLTILMVVFASQIARWMSTPPEAFRQTVSYLTICSAGTVFIVVYNAISAIFRGIGDSKSPLIFVMISCLLNVVADLFFVGGLKMGAAGAAYATVISQAVSVIFSIFYIRRIGLPFRFSIRHIQYSGGAVREILKIGVPVASQDLLNYFSFMILASIINSLGLFASAAMGIEGKVFSFFILVPVSFMSALSTFVAQNIGARQEKRAVQALLRGMAIAFVMGVISFCLAFFFGGFLAGIFDRNPESVYAASRLLKGAAFEHLLYPFVFCLLGYFNGRALTAFVMIQGAVCAFLIRIPLAWYLSRTGNEDLFWIGMALSLSALVSLILCVTYFFRKNGLRKFTILYRYRQFTRLFDRRETHETAESKAS